MSVPTTSVSQVTGVENLLFESIYIKDMEFFLESMGTEWKSHDVGMQKQQFYKYCRQIFESQIPMRSARSKIY